MGREAEERREEGRLELMHLNGDVVEGESFVCVCVCVCACSPPPAMTCRGDKSRDSEHLLSLSDVHTHTLTHTCSPAENTPAWTHTNTCSFQALGSETDRQKATSHQKYQTAANPAATHITEDLS